MSDNFSGEVPNEVYQEKEANINQINMNEIVGTHDILFVCLDTLRYDVAKEAETKNETPYINQYGSWEKCYAPGNFTYPSHHAMFAGFLPSKQVNKCMNKEEMLFFPKNIGLGSKSPKNSFAFEGATFIEGLAKVGYETICIGGVSFFNKHGDIGKVFPSMFQKSYWNPSFACGVKESPNNQIQWAIKKINEVDQEKRIMMYINIDAIHYPNYFYLDGETKDSTKTHKAALVYVDKLLPQIFDTFKSRNKTFVILCSDHGSCYGEDGYVFHGFNHEIVNTVPYKHFVL